MNVNGTDIAPVSTGTGYAAELKIPWTGTVGPDGLLVKVSDQPISVKRHREGFEHNNISMEYRNGLVTIILHDETMQRIEIVGADGAIVKRRTHGGNGRWRIDLNDLQSGIYFVRIHTENKTVSRPCMVSM